MHWDRLKQDLPEERRNIVAETDFERDVVIALATHAEPSRAVQPGQDPRSYNSQPLPVVFNRSISQAALRGAREIRGSSQDAFAVHVAHSLLEGLQIDAPHAEAA